MELCFNIQYLSKTVGLEKAAKALADAGFSYLDYTPPFDKDWKKITYEAADIFATYGLTVYQSHAPFNRYKRWGSVEKHKSCLAASVEAAQMLGAKYLVTHGDEFDFDHLTYSSKEGFKYNYEYFAPMVEQAEKCGVPIAFENLFEDMGVPRHCSKTEDLIDLIDAFGGSTCCCWDFGHGAVAYEEDNAKAIESMAGRIRCTHVHDNYLNTDAHLIPFYGKIDWQAAMRALKEGGIPEVLSFEMVYGNLPLSVVDAACKQFYTIGQTLCGMME